MALKTFANLRRTTRARGQRKGRVSDLRKPVKRPVRGAERRWWASGNAHAPHDIRQWRPWMGWRVRIYWATRTLFSAACRRL